MKPPDREWLLAFIFLVAWVCFGVLALSGCAHAKNGSVDLGVDIAQGVYPSVGVSYPVGPVWLSTGVWGGADFDGFRAWGPYISLGWSWSPE